MYIIYKYVSIYHIHICTYILPVTPPSWASTVLEWAALRQTQLVSFHYTTFIPQVPGTKGCQHETLIMKLACWIVCRYVGFCSRHSATCNKSGLIKTSRHSEHLSHSKAGSCVKSKDVSQLLLYSQHVDTVVLSVVLDTWVSLQQSSHLNLDGQLHLWGLVISLWWEPMGQNHSQLSSLCSQEFCEALLWSLVNLWPKSY